MKRIGAFVCFMSLFGLGLSGCGGGSGHSSSNSQGNGSRTLASITVTSANAASVGAGATLQLTAQGHYSDGTIANISSQVTWGTSNSSVATLNNAGLLTSYKSGSVVALATQGSVTGTLTVTVNAASLATISISGGASLEAGQAEQLSALGTYTDQSTQTLTS